MSKFKRLLARVLEFLHQNPYESCSCNSGKKYKFCCMNKEIELDI
ncbi:SEC-C metal-binding domain-containing protein [Bacillus mycoides]|nr:SEC-C metal-binding domain-containing protein [Bacillus mycoides]